MIAKNLEELKDLKQWVNYIRILNPTKNGGKGGFDKPPVSPHTLRDGRTNDPATWATYSQVEANIGKIAIHNDSKHKDAQGNVPQIRATIEGAGLVLCGGYAGVDLDHVIDESGRLAPFAAEVIRRLDTYTELSPSGTGLHCLLYCGDLLEAGQTFGSQFLLDGTEKVITEEDRKKYELEIYIPKTGGRYFTITGNVYHDRPIRRDKSDELRKIFDEYSAKREAYRAAKVSFSSVGTQYATTGRTGSDEEEKQMIDSALKAIPPEDLETGKWLSIMNCMHLLGYSLGEMLDWSAGKFGNFTNRKDDPAANARRHYNFSIGNPRGTIINQAKLFGWNPAQAFDDDARAEYGRSLHSEEERREYGRKKHEERNNEWFNVEDFQKWKKGLETRLTMQQAAAESPQTGAEGLQGENTVEAAKPSQTATESAQETSAAEDIALSVGTLETATATLQNPQDPQDDRREEWEAERVSAEEWTARGYYAVELHAVDMNPLDDRTGHKRQTFIGYEAYTAARDAVHINKWFIAEESFQTEEDYFPGLVTANSLIAEFENADDRYLQFENFPQFSERAKIKLHDSVILAADTGAGKSSLALNFLNDLNDEYPVLYFNLEMDKLIILRRLVAIHTGMELDRIEGYKNDVHTQGAVNSALRGIASRKPLQIIGDVYYLEDIKKHIKRATEGRTEPVIVIVDHALLVNTRARYSGRYERFTMISEELRKIAKDNNIIMFVLLQQSRSGKQDEEKRPTNSSLKESGSWENDSTHILFLWWDPTVNRKKLILTKNRGGEGEAEYILNYWKKTQTYTEAKNQSSPVGTSERSVSKPSKRSRATERLKHAIEDAIAKVGREPTARDIAVAMDVTTATAISYIKEYGPELGLVLNGEPVKAKGKNDILDITIAETDFVRLSEEESSGIMDMFEPVTGQNHFG